MHKVGERGLPAHGTIAAVVVTFNSARLLPDFFASLSRALTDVPASEIVVVDNDSGDATLDIVATCSPAATIVQLEHNAGYAAGINAGVQAAAPADAVLVLNPDVRLQPGSVRRLIAGMAEAGVGIVVPRMLDEHGRLFPSLRREPTVLRAWGEAVLGGNRAGRHDALGEVVQQPWRYETAGRAGWATGAVMLISRACLESVGPWDQSFFLYSEETDFALRARDAGFALRYVPEAVATHLGGESSISPPLHALLTRNRVRLYRKRHTAARAALYWCALAVNEAIRAARGSRVHGAGLRALLGRRPAGDRSTTALRREPSRTGTAPGYICFAAVDWWYHNRAHSDIQLMRNVAARRPVLFVNSIALRMPLPGRSSQPLRRIARKARSMARSVQRPDPGLPAFHVMTPVMVPLYGSTWGRAFNARFVAFQVRRAARRRGIIDPVCVVTIPTAWDAVRRVRHRSLVYNRSDLHSAFPEADGKYIGGLERALLRAADHVVYVSHVLLEQERPLTDGRAHFLDHGVDLEHFRADADDPEPADLALIPRPRIGFFGAIDDFVLDIELLRTTARGIPEAQLVLIGDATVPMGELKHMPNVHWLGSRDYSEIPSYGRGFDVAIMPWRDNEWIRHCNPIKLKEYLALGLPVVSTDFPEIAHYRDVVTVASSPDEFVSAVRSALAAGRSPLAVAERVARIAGDSWRDRAAELIALVEGPSSPARENQGA